MHLVVGINLPEQRSNLLSNGQCMYAPHACCMQQLRNMTAHEHVAWLFNAFAAAGVLMAVPWHISACITASRYIK